MIKDGLKVRSSYHTKDGTLVRITGCQDIVINEVAVGTYYLGDNEGAYMSNGVGISYNHPTNGVRTPQELMYKYGEGTSQSIPEKKSLAEAIYDVKEMASHHGLTCQVTLG